MKPAKELHAALVGHAWASKLWLEKSASAVLKWLSSGSQVGRNFYFTVKLPIHCKCCIFCL